MSVHKENSAELNKHYLAKGTTFDQINMIYSYNGASYDLAYIAQTPDPPLILNGIDQVSAVTGGWTIQNNGGEVYEQGWREESLTGGPAGWYMSYNGNNVKGQAWMTTKNKIEISGCTALKLTSFYQKGYGDATPGSGYIYVALTTGAGYAGGSPGSSSMKGSNIFKSKVVMTEEKSGTITVTLDVSGVEGAYYVQVGRWNKTSACVFTTAFLTVTFE